MTNNPLRLAARSTTGRRVACGLKREECGDHRNDASRGGGGDTLVSAVAAIDGVQSKTEFVEYACRRDVVGFGSGDNPRDAKFRNVFG